MVRITVLGSGSSGNATVLELGSIRLLIDAGFSCKRLAGKLESAGIPPDSLSGILITHEHTDHIQALPIFTKKWDIPVYITRHTHASLPKSSEHTNWRFFESGSSFAIGAAIITTFSVPHDAADPVGFRIDYRGVCYGHLSDAGNATQDILDHLSGVNILFIESNYDLDLLQSDTKRPWSTKQRICSYHGHLSNEQAGECICKLAHNDLHHIILGHLSKDCNTPDVALRAMNRALSTLSGSCSPSIYCSMADEASPWIVLKPESEDSDIFTLTESF